MASSIKEIKRPAELSAPNSDASTFFTVNPATGEQIETFPFFTAQETEAALVRADKSFKSYRKLSGASTRTTTFKPRRDVTEEQGTAGESNHNGDGKDSFGGRRRSGEVRLGSRLVCRARAADVCRLTRPDRQGRGICFVSAAWDQFSESCRGISRCGK